MWLFAYFLFAQLTTSRTTLRATELKDLTVTARREAGHSGGLGSVPQPRPAGRDPSPQDRGQKTGFLSEMILH